VIRPARPEDFPRLNALIHDCGLAIEGVAYDRWEPVTLVCECKGEIIGVAQALLGMPYAVITEVAIDPRYQHQGHGIRLLSHLETVLREYGVTAWVTFAGSKSDAADMLNRLAVQIQGTGHAFVKRLQ
jgi:N-acetylglutamate synthase-like GNAT family acetyltransferase